MTDRALSVRLSMGLAALSLLLGGCSSENAASQVSSDWAATPSELETIITEIVVGCQEAGGLHSECECTAEWLVYNTSVDDVAFGAEPPLTGGWIYLGGNLYVPVQHQSAIERCMQ